MRLLRRTLDQIDPPVGSVDAIRPTHFPGGVLDMSQGAPSYPTAPVIIDRVREVAADSDGSRYTDGFGIPELRSAFAHELSRDYDATIPPEAVLITAGSNQAFCLTTSALAERGDEVILSTPFYFNHDMWVRLDGLRPVYAETSPDSGQLDVAAVAARVTDRTRMIVLVSPGNPTGVTATPDVVDELADLARDRGVVLVLDETYRVFRSGPAHRVFERPDWAEYFVSLHSFSKDYAIPGYRVGAVVGAPALLDQAIKLMDCVAICAPRIGQEAALEGLRSAGEWRAEKVAEVEERHQRFREVMADSPGGFRLHTSGGFYGWVRHPALPRDTGRVVRRLGLDLGVLTLAGTAFSPEDQGFVRFSYANIEPAQIDELARRLSRF